MESSAQCDEILQSFWSYVRFYMLCCRDEIINAVVDGVGQKRWTVSVSAYNWPYSVSYAR